MRSDLQKKVKRAVKLIQSASKIASANGCKEIEVAYSGGKDSDVILELAKMAGVPYRAIYKNTTIDPAGTIKHAIDNGVEVRRPKVRFFELVKENGFPNQHRRFCCRHLKEYKVLDYAIIGIRREESAKRAKRYNEPEQCRVYSKTEKVRQYFPILEWTSQDVEDFVKDRNIRCAPLYYDEDGNFHVERRLGCLCCPLQGHKMRLRSFAEHPNMIKAYIRAGGGYLATHTDGKIYKTYNGNVYAWLVRDLFYPDDKNGWEDINNGLFPPPNYKEILEKKFGIKL